MPRNPKARYSLEAEDNTDRGLRQAEGRLRSFQRIIEVGLGNALANVGSRLAGWAASILDAGARLAELEAQAKDLGQTLEEAAAIELFADLQESTVGQVTSAVEKLNEVLGQAVAGEETAVELMRELRLEAEGVARLPPLAQLALVGQQLQTLPVARRTRVRTEVLGGGAGRLVSGDVAGAALRASQEVPRDLRTTAARAAEAEDTLDVARFRIGQEFNRLIFNPESAFGGLSRLGGVPGAASAGFAPPPGVGGLVQDSGTFILALDRQTRILEQIQRNQERGQAGGLGGFED